MKKIYPILLIIFLMTALPAFAKINKDTEIYTAFQEMLDRDPTMGEYHDFVKGYKGKDFVKSSLNKIDERREVIKNIYQRALKRNPRQDETDALVRFVAPNNLIREQLFTSKERELAIIDAYSNFLDRAPAQSDLEFYIKTRSPFEKIKKVLNSSKEREIVLIKNYKIKNNIEPNPSELAYMIENQTAIASVDEVESIEYVEAKKEDGPLKITIFNDFECVYCGDFYKTIQKIKQAFDGEIEITTKHFPLTFHKEAQKAAIAYECAKEQGKADSMAVLIYQARRDEQMGVERWKAQASGLGLNTEQFNQCLDTDKYLEKIETDVKTAESLNITATPTTIIENEKILGNISFDYIADEIKLKLD
jgi:protein-disulfide isomerase